MVSTVINQLGTPTGPHGALAHAWFILTCVFCLQELEGLKGQIAELLSSQFASPDEVQAADDVSSDSCRMLLVVPRSCVIS